MSGYKVLINEELKRGTNMIATPLKQFRRINTSQCGPRARNIRIKFCTTDCLPTCRVRGNECRLKIPHELWQCVLQVSR